MSETSLRELFLIRHAKTDRQGTDACEDHHLSPKGKKQACKLGDWIKQNHIRLDAVYLSPDTRVSQTFRRLKLDAPSTHKEVLPLLENANLEILIQFLGQVPTQQEKVCIIGHESGLKALIQHLEEDDHGEHCNTSLFPSGALAHFILPHAWQALPQGSGKLVQLIRPKDI